MADTKYQVALHGESNLPEDDAVNVLYFDTDDTEATMDDLAAVYNAQGGLFNTFFRGQGMTIKAYDPDGGQPTLAKDYAFAPTARSAGPTELAICLSYASVDDPASSTARRRGRIYIPTSASNDPRPPDSLISLVLDFGEDLASLGTANAQTWKLWSTTDQASAKIESIWCDDAWDTQRRRGVAPTKRVVRDVQ